jgi:hypothetical protein
VRERKKDLFQIFKKDLHYFFNILFEINEREFREILLKIKHTVYKTHVFLILKSYDRSIKNYD